MERAHIITATEKVFTLNQVMVNGVQADTKWSHHGLKAMTTGTKNH
jgi:hypothetical protein